MCHERYATDRVFTHRTLNTHKNFISADLRKIEVFQSFLACCTHVAIICGMETKFFLVKSPLEESSQAKV